MADMYLIFNNLASVVTNCKFWYGIEVTDFDQQMVAVVCPG